ncbi:hypothetical protein OG394_05735 [Kribbella sp. NBC_01245]|uniref:hypothetical protein n=1 Tax=Kribbella sp. NBC_01245 TaxID=2903578 RepID=UPI002E2A5F24|nr:hypothetical protein [Kribbella sp. NBC_01245]
MSKASFGLAALLLVVSACSGPKPADEHAGHPAGAMVDVKIESGKTVPSGAVVKVSKDEQITVNITSDIDDEIHVHSTPDHSFQISAGQKLEETFSFGATGTYEMESHRLKKLIVKFEVR